MKTVKHLLIVLFTISTKITLAQLQLPKPAQNFYTWATETERYLDSMRVVINNDSVFYHEGGMYAEYQRYFNIYRHEASSTGDRLLYSQQLNTYYQHHPLNSGMNNRSASANNDAWEELGRQL